MDRTATLALFTALLTASPVPADEAVFTTPTPLAERREVARRMLHGWQWLRVERAAAARDDDLSGSGLDPAAERWEVHIPASCADRPCGVLVWIQPWDDASLPRDWVRVLDDAGVIYVSARRSGNDQGVLDRRVPLALLGLAGVQATQRVDPERIWVGGFSGGGRVASRIAAGYADVFRGGLFVGTADGLGSADAPTPADPALTALLSHGRYWFVVGSEDPENLHLSRQAWRLYRSNCAASAELKVVSGWHHRTLDARWLSRALDALSAASDTDLDAVQVCRRAHEQDGRAALARARGRLAEDPAEGWRLALEVHARFGGFVAPEFADLVRDAPAPAADAGP